MSWEELTPLSHALAMGDRITVAIAPEKGQEKARCNIRIGRSLAERAGLPFREKGRVKVFIGNGGDAGRVRIAADDEGRFTADPRGKSGAIRICVPPPKGSPPEFKAKEAEWSLEKSGLVFVLPWHKRAADLEVEELPQLPTVAQSDDGAHRTRGGKPVEEFIGEVAPPTLDAIQEAARPDDDDDDDRLPPSAIKSMEAMLEVAAGKPTRKAPPRVAPDVDELRDKMDELVDKPVNGTAKQHVYHDSERNSRTFLFTHKDKSARMNGRQFNFAKRLYAAMQKVPEGILTNDQLMAAIDTKETAILTSTAIAVEGLVAPLGLEIVFLRKTGYRMKEA